MLSKGQRTYLEKRRREIRREILDSTDLNNSNTFDLEKKGRLESQLHKTDYTIKNKAKKALEDLTLIAKMIPEKQKSEIFTKDSMREFIKAVLKDGDGKKFDELINRDIPYHPEPEIRKKLYAEFTERERKSGLPEPIYNKRIFDLGVLLAGFGVSSAYDVISWKLRFKDINKQPTKGEMWNLIDSVDAYGYLFDDLKKDKK